VVSRENANIRLSFFEMQDCLGYTLSHWVGKSNSTDVGEIAFKHSAVLFIFEVENLGEYLSIKNFLSKRDRLETHGLAIILMKNYFSFNLLHSVVYFNGILLAVLVKSLSGAR